MIVIGLNVYRSSMEKSMYDFNDFEEEFCGKDHDSEQDEGEGMSRLSRIECEFHVRSVGVLELHLLGAQFHASSNFIPGIR